MKILSPKISILLPNLNNFRFLEERLQSILEQTFTDWELVVVDSYSDDGAWELIQEYAKKEARMRTFQAPREGVYAGINQCINLARADYIYIATSDDTMSPDCLEKMFNELEKHPECDLCHCCLTIIDEYGNNKKNDWLNLPSVKYFGDFINKKHIRYAPHDAILYCCIYNTYTSLTQLLIRKKVFKKVGLFKSDFGSLGDFEWGLRITLVCNTIHLPNYLATWRRHSNQLTNDNLIFSAKGHGIFCEMIECAFNYHINKKTQQSIIKNSMKELMFVYKLRQTIFSIREQEKWIIKIVILAKNIIQKPYFFMAFMQHYILGKEFNSIKYSQKLLNSNKIFNGLHLI